MLARLEDLLPRRRIDGDAGARALFAGDRGFAAAYQLIGRVARLCWDSLG